MKEKILLVDDEEGIRKVLGISLTDSGYDVLFAENGEEAIRIFKEQQPEIVLTDIKMPGMDGIEVLRKIKHENPDTEVIVITGHGDMQLAIKSLKYEATDFITKPVDDTHLENALQKSRERILLRKQLKSYTENLERLIQQKTEKLADAGRIQKTTQASSEKYQHLFDQMPCYVAVLGKDLRITAFNRLFREDFNGEIGSYCYKIFKRADKPCEICPVIKTFENRQSHQSEMQLTGKNGKQRNMVLWTKPLGDAGKDVLQVLLMFTDISQLIDLKDHLASLGLMIGSVSHSIKGMLTGLDGGVYLLDSGFSKDDPNKVSEGLEIVKIMVGRIKTMVLDILYYAKERELNRAQLDVLSFAKDTADVVEAKMRNHHIEFVRDFNTSSLMPASGEQKLFFADEEQLRSAIVNILENAVDACTEDKSKTSHKITFGVRGDKNEIVFEISDNGIGMTQETKEKIFTLFFSSKAVRGTGIGLFLSEKIVRQHKGLITVDSEPGQGTHFYITVPLAETEA